MSLWWLKMVRGVVTDWPNSAPASLLSLLNICCLSELGKGSSHQKQREMVLADASLYFFVVSFSWEMWVEMLPMPPPNGLFIQVPLESISLFVSSVALRMLCLFTCSECTWILDVSKNLSMWAYIILYNSNNSFKGMWLCKKF